MNQDAIEEAARLLARSRLERAPLEALPEACRPGGEAEAYAVQARLHLAQQAAGLGARVGWKIGCTTPVMQSYMGIDHPCYGGLFAATLSEERGRYDFDDFCRVGVECEIVVRLGAALAPASHARSSFISSRARAANITMLSGRVSTPPICVRRSYPMTT